jgi:hypothetical protein
MYLRFHDAEPLRNGKPPDEIVLMTASHARKIWDFVLRHYQDIGTIVVHCEQSDAIADQNFVKVRLAGSWLTNQQQVASSAPKPLQILLAAHEGWSFGAGSRWQCG